MLLQVKVCGTYSLFNKIYPLNYTYHYHLILGGEELEYVESEKDLGVYETANLSWDNHIDFLYSKASSRLGVLKRALHFVKCPKQKSVFYLAVARSIFEHCVQVWTGDRHRILLFKKLNKFKIEQ